MQCGVAMGSAPAAPMCASSGALRRAGSIVAWYLRYMVQFAEVDVVRGWGSWVALALSEMQGAEAKIWVMWVIIGGCSEQFRGEA